MACAIAIAWSSGPDADRRSRAPTGMPSFFSFSGLLGLDLVAHQADVFGLRPDEMQVVIGEGFRQSGRLSEEKSRSRDHRVGAGDFAGRRAAPAR